jgi:hypothetical protein
MGGAETVFDIEFKNATHTFGHRLFYEEAMALP